MRLSQSARADLSRTHVHTCSEAGWGAILQPDRTEIHVWVDWAGRVRLGQAGAATPHCDQQDYMFDWTVRRSRHVHTYMYMRSWHYIYMYMYRLHVHVTGIQYRHSTAAYMYMYRKRPWRPLR